MVQGTMNCFSDDQLCKDSVGPCLKKQDKGNPSKMETIRKRKGTIDSIGSITSGMDSMDSEADDDDDNLSRISYEDNRKFARANHSEIEKRRRDKMNSYIAELSTMVPMCSAMNRKLDKLTVLRMAVQHMKTLRGAGDARTEVSQKPSFLSDDELKHLILKAADGFLFVVSCDRGRILYVSESVKNMLNYTQSELIGQSLFDFLHPKDIPKIKEQLLSSDVSPREKLIDAKTMLPVKTELPQTHSQLCSGARRSFICRMKTGSSIKTEKDQQTYMCSKKKKADRKNFSVIHCLGYLKSWPPAKVGIEQEDSEGDTETCNLSCLVAIGNFLPAYSSQSMEESLPLEVRPTQFMSRFTPDGMFVYVDQSATAVLGYLPQELLGTSVYEYYHYKDIDALSETHKKKKIESPVYQFKMKDGSFVHLKTKASSFKNPWTKEIDFIVATNTVVPVVEVSSSGQCLDVGGMTVEELSPEMPRAPQDVSRIPGGTVPGAGKIGRQIADKVLEMQEDNNHLAVDSSIRSGRQFGSGGNVSSTDAPMLGAGQGPAQTAASGTRLNGLSVNLHRASQEGGGALLNNLMEQDSLSESNPDANDEAAMAVIMSLLEADAGLGGPVDFSDLPWPL